MLIMLLGVAITADAAPSSNVAYRRIDVQDVATGALFPVALWYPTRAASAPLFLTGPLSACRLPAMLCRWIAFEMQAASDAPPADGKFGLIVISHGAGGNSLNHRDLAMALASHSYVVAAPTHPPGRDNDISGIGVWVGRPKQVSRVIDAVLEDTELGPHIQLDRIGVVGHSNGGYTALAVVGAKPNPQAVIAHCRQHPDDARFCSYGGAATREATRKIGEIPDVRDPRVRAIVLMAPNASPFTDEALARVAVPVRAYGAERDDLTVARYHAERLAKALPPETEYILIKRAGHFSFVASFPWALRVVVGEAARDPEGFDRDAMHEVMNPEIVDFFNRKLRSGKNMSDEGAWTQMSTSDQRAIDAYRSALTSVAAMASPRGIESAFSALTSVREALLGIRDGQKTVLEALSDSEFMRLKRELPGALINRDEVVYIEPDADYFARLAATRGNDADRSFFAALKRTYPESVWPVYVDQTTDYGGCTRFGSMSLVGTYRTWSEFRRKYPDRYVAGARRAIDQVLEHLTTSTCACGNAAAVEQELERFRTRFPTSAARSRIDARLAALRAHRSDIRTTCVAG